MPQIPNSLLAVEEKKEKNKEKTVRDKVTKTKWISSRQKCVLTSSLQISPMNSLASCIAPGVGANTEYVSSSSWLTVTPGKWEFRRALRGTGQQSHTQERLAQSTKVLHAH